MEVESITADKTDQTIVEDLALEEPSSASLNLPLSRVKRIAKLVAPSSNITAEATQLLTLGAEMYVQLLSKAAFKFSQLDNRKTIQLKDVYRCIERDWHFSILEDAIDDWPVSQGGSLRTATGTIAGEASRRKDTHTVDENVEENVGEKQRCFVNHNTEMKGTDSGSDGVDDDYFDVDEPPLHSDDNDEATNNAGPSARAEVRTARIRDIEDF